MKYAKVKWFRILGFILLLVFTCIGVSLAISSLMMKNEAWKHDKADGHQWLYEQLDLNETEMERIDAFERVYREQRKKLLDEYNIRIKNVQNVIKENEHYSEDVTHAVHHLHEIHGDIQQLSIRHYYDMLSVLPPAKQQLLKNIAVEALSVPE